MSLRALARNVLEQTQEPLTPVPVSRPYTGGTLEQNSQCIDRIDFSCSKAWEQNKQAWNKCAYPEKLREIIASIQTEDIPKVWIDGFSKLCAMPSSSAHSPDRWRQIKDDCKRFMASYAFTAASLGWATLDLFGVDPVAPDWRLDNMGLLPLLDGRRIAAFTADTAAIDANDCTAMTFYRRIIADGAIPLWELKP